MLTKYAEAVELEFDDLLLSVPANAGPRRLARARRQAHRHNFEYTPRRGYIYVRSRAISSRCNDNFDEFPASEIKTAYRTFIGKPVFVNHHNADHRRARGVIIDAALHEDTNPDGSPDTWAEVLMEVDAVKFPVLAREVMKGNIARTSMGTDVEYSVCTACGNKAYSPADYCKHIPAMKGMKHVRFNAATGAREEVVIAERCYGLGFFENSLLVEDPADPTAFTLGNPDGTPETLAMFASIEREADQVVAEAEEITRTASRSTEAFSHDTRGVPYSHDYGRSKPRKETAPAGTRTFQVDVDKTSPGYGGGSAEHMRAAQDEDDRRVQRERRRVQREHGITNGQMPDARGPRKANRHVEAGQCVYCNPALRATGSNLMCNSHAFQASNGAIDFPSHNNSTGWFDYPDRNPHPAFTALMQAEGLTYGPGAIFDGDPSLDSAIETALQHLPIKKQVVAPEYVDGYVVLELPGKSGPVYQVYDENEQEPGGLMPPSERPPGEIVARVDKDGKVTKTGSRHLAVGEHFWMDGAQIGWQQDHKAGEHEDKPQIGCRLCFPLSDAQRTRIEQMMDGLAEVRSAEPGLYDRAMRGASRHLAYGETKAPAKVDTMRAENCPVCGDDEGYNGDKCNVCGYMQPPSQFQDPDLTKAREQDLRQEGDPNGLEQDPNALGEEQPAEDLQCTNCGEVFASEQGEPEASTDPADEAEEEAEPEHPEDPEDSDREKADKPEDLSDLADSSDKDLFDDEDEEDEDEPEEEEDPDEDDPEDLPPDPAIGEGRITAEPEGTTEDIGDLKIEPNMTCPVCGLGTLVPKVGTPPGEPKLNEVGTDPAKAKETVAMTQQQQRRQPNQAQERRNRVIAAVQEQQGVIEGLRSENARLVAQVGLLTHCVATIGGAAGLERDPRFARLIRQAGITVRADSDTNNSPSGAPSTSTEEAKKPDGTDDVESVGAGPGEVNKGVTPEGVTDVNNSDVTVNPPVLDNLQDATAPVGGTDAVTPAAGDAGGASQVSVGNPEQKAFDTPAFQAAVQRDRERFTASLRLARLQLHVGAARGEDLTIGQTIFDSPATLGEINAQAQALQTVASQKQAETPNAEQRRRLVPQAQPRQGGVQPLAQPSLSTVSAVESRPGEDEWMVGGVDD